MAGFRKFEEIDAWKLGRTLVRSVYKVTRKDPFSHDWGLRDQIQRAAVSVCSNIAEGYARRGNKEFVKFLWIAKGSAAEVQSQLINASDLGYVDGETCQKLYGDADLISAKLYKLITALSDPEGKGLSYTKV